MSIVLSHGSVISQEEFQDIIEQLSSDPNFRQLYEARTNLSHNENNNPSDNVKTSRSKSVADISFYAPNTMQNQLKRGREEEDYLNFPPTKKLSSPTLDIECIRKRGSLSHFQNSWETTLSPVDCNTSSSVHLPDAAYQQDDSFHYQSVSYQQSVTSDVPYINVSFSQTGTDYNYNYSSQQIQYKAPVNIPRCDNESNDLSNVACDVEQPISTPINQSRRHSIAHFPVHSKMSEVNAPIDDSKVTKWTNVTASVTKKYSKPELGSDPLASQNDVKLMMGKWKCTKFRVN